MYHNELCEFSLLFNEHKHMPKKKWLYLSVRELTILHGVIESVIRWKHFQAIDIYRKV